MTVSEDPERIKMRGRPTSEDRADDPILVPDLALLGMDTEGADGAQDDDIHRRMIESTCGATDDSQNVGTYDGTLGVTVAFVNAHQSAVGQVQWNNNLATIYTNPGNVSGARWGSGTMISADLFLTCGHLFDQTGGDWHRPRQNGTTNIISPAEIALNMRINFNYQTDAAGNNLAEQSFAITQLIEYRLGGLDVAICRVAGNPGSGFGFTAVSTVDAAANDPLCIIGHPLALRKRIEAGVVQNIAGNEIQYNDIDTQGGNSGSGILHGTTGRLVGVHTNGGCTSTGGHNFGMRIAAAIANSPTLRNLNTATGIIRDFGGTGVVRDLGGTGLVRDIGTSPNVDVYTLKVADIGTGAVRDLGGTAKVLDLGGTLNVLDAPHTRKGFDDIKQPHYDKHPGSDRKNLFDNPVGIDPLFDPARPFVMATPHHTEIPAEFGTPEAEVTREDYEAALTELEAQFQAVLDDYQNRFGNQ